MDERGFSLSDVVGIFRRRLRLVVAVAGSIFLLSVVIAAVLRDEFTVYATILVEPQSISKKLVESGKEEQDVINRLHLMTMQILSRARLSKVIDELKLYPEESEEKTREQVIDMMRSRIQIEPVLPDLDPELKRKMDIQVNTFRLFFRHEDPNVGAAVANRLSNDFIDEHIKERVQSSGDTADFVESELQRLTGRLRELEAQIAQVKSQNAGSLPDDVFANQRQVESSFDAFSLAQQRLAEAQSDQAFYAQQATVARESGLGGGGAQQYDQVLSPNRAAAAPREPAGRVAQPRLHRQASRRDRDARRDGAGPRAHRDAAATRSGSPRAHVGRGAAGAQRSAARRDCASRAARREAERLQKEVEQAQARLAATPRVAEQLDALEREYKNLSAAAKEFSNKRLEAGVAANMERRQKGEQFRVLEPAYAPPEPTSPNRPLIIVLGLMLGIGAGAGLALLLDAMDSSYHDPRALQVALRLPVLASIPAILLDADRMRMRRRNLREAVRGRRRHGLRADRRPRGLRVRQQAQPVPRRERADGADSAAGRRDAAGRRRPHPRAAPRRPARPAEAGRDAMYLQHFGLLRAPFEMTPDPAFLYLGESHQRRAGDAASTAFGPARVSCCSPARSGPARRRCCTRCSRSSTRSTAAAFVFNPRLEPLDFFRVLFDEFGIEVPCTTKAEYLIALNKFLIERLERDHADAADRGRGAEPVGRDARGDPPALEPRDAHLEAAPDHAGGAARAGRDAARSRSCASCASASCCASGCGPSTPTRPSTTCRSGCASRATRARASSSAARCRRLHHVTGGVPRLVNVVCDGALLLGYSRGQATVDAEAMSTRSRAISCSRRATRRRKLERSRRPRRRKRALAEQAAQHLPLTRRKRRSRDGQGLRSPAAGRGGARSPRRAGAGRRGAVRGVSIRRAQPRTQAGASRGCASWFGELRAPVEVDDANAFNKRRIALLQPDSFVAEQFRSLRARLDALAAERPMRTIAVTSAMPGEGKTTAAMNLALVTAMSVGRRVLLVDCDLRQPEGARRARAASRVRVSPRCSRTRCRSIAR